MTRRVAVLIACVAALAVGTSPAHAAPDWVAGASYPVPPGKLVHNPVVRFQDGGIANDLWLELRSPTANPADTVLHLATKAPGGDWAEQLSVAATDTAVPLGFDLAVAPNGAAVAVWEEATSRNLSTVAPPLRYRAAYRRAGATTWGEPVTVAENSVPNGLVSSVVKAAISADGTAAVAIGRIEPNAAEPAPGQTDGRFDVATHTAAGWRPAARLSPVDQSADGISIAFDDAGNLTVAYRLRFSEGSTSAESDDRRTVIVRRRSASSGLFGGPEDLAGSSITASTGFPVLGVGPGGDAVVAFQYLHGGTADVWATTRQGVAGSWASNQRVATAASPFAAAVAPKGTAYVEYVFQGTVATAGCIGGVRAPAGGTFTGHRCLSPTNLVSFGNSGPIAFLGNDAYMAWTARALGSGSSDTVVQAARWPDAAGLPEVARDLDTPSGHVLDAAIVPDRHGSVVAFWREADGTTAVLKHSAYDAGGPSPTGSAVPATAVAGQPVALSASFVDLWSGLAADQPTWEFGDLSPAAAGATVSHTFAAAGTYSVTAAAADTRGNRSSATFRISVTASGPTPPDAPDITELRLTPPDFRAATRGATITAAKLGTRVTYRGTKAAKTTFAVLRERPGIRRGARCVPRPRTLKRGARRCKRFVPVGTFARTGVAGPNSFRFSGRLRGRKLPVGPYRLTARPMLESRAGKLRSAPFKIVPARRTVR